MFWKRKKAHLSLRGKILAALLPGMLAIIGAELWLTRLDAVDAANAAFDRSLSGAIKSLELNISTASGGLAVELPYRLFEFFQLTAHGTVYFRVASADGLVEIGSPDLPRPERLPALGEPVFEDALYLGEAVRVGTSVRALESPLSPGGVQKLVIQVAESVESRRAFMRSFVLRAAARDALVISLVGFGIALLLSLLLRPVSRLASQVAGRAPSDLRALEAQPDLPRDLLPLVDAINRQLQRTQDLMARQRQFLDDASHQLRTPLATLHAQVGYAQRQKDAGELKSALDSIGKQLEHATRGTNQLLALARSDAQSLNRERFDLNELAREIGTGLLPLARAKELDFGIEVADAPVWCFGDRALLFEAASNLAHNAIKYTQAGGQVTIIAGQDEQGYRLGVTNTGPAIPAAVQRQLGERFVKGHSDSGSGLGLAIAKTIAERHGGRLRIERLDEVQANCAGLWWPIPRFFDAMQEEER